MFADFLIRYPGFAAVIGAIFVVLWAWRRVQASLIAGLTWLIYSAYECAMFLRILCSGDCNIRIDLLLIYPLLLALSLYALFRYVKTPIKH